MKQRIILKTAASSAALLLLMSACGEDRPDSVSAGGDGNGGTQSPSTVKSPAKIKVAGTGTPASGGGRESAGTPNPSADAAQGKMAATSMMAQQVTYVAGPSLADLTGARGSWFFPADGFVVTDEQKAALAAALGASGTWVPLPADWGGGEALGPTDGSGPNITISSDAMRSWWFNPGPGAYPVAEPCVTSTDAATGQERTECPTPTPPVGVPDQATAEAKARELFTAMGMDPARFELESYADEWGAWVTGWLLLDGERAPVTMYVGFGAEGAVTGAGGFLAEPIQGDQYDLVGITEGIARLNDQQYGWLGMGAMAKDAASAAGSGVAGSSGTAESEPATTIVEPVAGDPETVPPLIDPMPCEVLVRPATDEPVSPDDTAVGGGSASSPVPCPPPMEIVPITVTLTGVDTDLTMVWDAEGTVWLLPAYTFTDDQGGQYTVIAIDDAFIELPAPVPMPEPLPVETQPVETVTDPAAAVVVDQAAADTLLGLAEAEAIKVAESNGWTARVVARDGEQFPATADYREDRVSLTVDGGVITAVTIG